MINDADDNLVVRYAGSSEHGYPYNPVSGRRFKGRGLSPVQADALPVTGNISALPEFGYLRPGTALNLPFPSQGPTTTAALTALIPPPLAVRR